MIKNNFSRTSESQKWTTFLTWDLVFHLIYIFASLEFMFFSASLDRFISVQLKNKNTVKSENCLVIYSQIVHLLQFSQQRPL